MQQQEKRNDARYKKVKFKLQLVEREGKTAIAHDASIGSASFAKSFVVRRNELEGGQFQLGNDVRKIDRVLNIHKSEERDKIIVKYSSSPMESGRNAKHEEIFLRSELDRIWDRYKELEQKNKLNTQSSFRLFGLLMLYAAAPFTLERFLTSSMVRVWALGGLWIAMVTWFYSDRSFRSYGNHLVERILCLKQINQLRTIMVGHWDRYRRLSFLPIDLNKKYLRDCGNPAHISSQQIDATVYLYKVASFFFPAYLILFATLIVAPLQIIQSDGPNGLSLFLRVNLGAFLIWGLWVHNSYARCVGIEQAAFRARRVSLESPWPLFPNDDEILMGSSYHFASNIIIYFLLLAASIVNIVRFGFIFFGDFRLETDELWGEFDLKLLMLSVVIFLLAAAWGEMKARYILKEAKKQDKEPEELTNQRGTPGAPLP